MNAGIANAIVVWTLSLAPSVPAQAFGNIVVFEVRRPDRRTSVAARLNAHAIGDYVVQYLTGSAAGFTDPRDLRHRGFVQLDVVVALGDGKSGAFGDDLGVLILRQAGIGLNCLVHPAPQS